MKLLPILSVQHDLPDVLRDLTSGATAAEDVWISAYAAASSVHGKARLTDSNHTGLLSTTLDLTASLTSSPQTTKLQITCDSLSVPSTTVTFPATRRTLRMLGGVTALANDAQGRGAVGGCKGKLVLYPSLSDGVGGRELRGFVDDVSTVLFVQNHVVAGSLDMSIRLFLCPSDASTSPLLASLVLTGHTRAITSIGRWTGESIMSTSLDGSLRRWDLAEGTEEARWNLDGEIHALCTVPEEGKIFLAHSNGRLTCLDPSSSLPNHTFATVRASAITAIDYDPSTGLLVAGSREGRIYLFSTRGDGAPREAQRPLGCWGRNTAGVTGLSFRGEAEGNREVLVANADGLPCRLAFIVPSPLPVPMVVAAVKASGAQEEVEDPFQMRVAEEFGGIDCDPCVLSSSAKVACGGVWLGGGDGVVRCYF